MPPERIVGFIWVARQVGLLCEARKRNGIVSSTANLQPLENHQTEQSFSVCQLQGNLPYHLGVTEVMVFLCHDVFCVHSVEVQSNWTWPGFLLQAAVRDDAWPFHVQWSKPESCGPGLDLSYLGRQRAQQSARKWYSKCGFCLHLQVLHVWFARDKGANYGFCEIASQEEWATLLSDSRRLNVKKTGMESENEVGPLVHKAENVWQKCGLSHGSVLLVQALHAGDGACFAAGWHAGFRWEIISAKREEWKIEYGKRQPRRNTLNG